MLKIFRGNPIVVFVLVVSSVVVLSLGHGLWVYNSQKEIREQKLFKSTSDLSAELKSSFDYVSHILHFLGGQIADDNPQNLEKIANLLQNNLVTNEKMRQQFSWAMFDWSTPDYKMVASTAWGMIKEPIDISHRNYAQKAFSDPWKLHFDKPDVGISSGQWIIPAGMGVTSINGKPLGIISMGFNIHKLSLNTAKIAQSTHVDYIIFDKDYDVIIDSKNNTKTLNEHKESLLSVKESITESGLGKLQENLEINDAIFTHYQSLDGYPYIVLVGYDKSLVYQELKEHVLPLFIIYGLIGAIVLALFTVMRNNVLTLSKQIQDKENYKNVKLARPLFPSLNDMVRVALDIMKKYKRSERKNKKLSQKIEILERAKRYKEQLLFDLYWRQQSFYTFALYEENNDALQEHKPHVNMIKYQSACIKALVEESIAIQMPYALDKNIALTVTFENIPPSIEIDAIYFRQAITSLIYHSIYYIPKGGKCEVSVVGDKAKSVITISIVDNGWPQDIDERNAQWEKRSDNLKCDVIHISLERIQRIFTILQGSFSLETYYDEGNKFEVCLPIDMKKDLFASDSNSKNVIQFPKM